MSELTDLLQELFGIVREIRELKDPAERHLGVWVLESIAADAASGRVVENAPDDARSRPISPGVPDDRVMNVVWGLLITLATTGLAVTAMLVVRGRAPEGSWFQDGDRASGVFGVIATGFSVLLGFVVFLSFTSYDNARAGAEDEALMVAQQVETAQLLGPEASGALTGQLICYGRSVVSGEWPAMQDGTIGEGVNPWGVAMFQTIENVRPVSNAQQSAYDQWLAQTSTREEGRLTRIHPASGVIPTPLWIVLVAIGAVIFAYMLFFADAGEGRGTQAMLMGAVVAVITMMFLLLLSLDRPFHPGVGGLQPVAMERTLTRIDHALAAVGRTVPIPCDAAGSARS